MKSLVRLAPRRPEVVLYWVDPDGRGGSNPLPRRKKHDRMARWQHELEDLDEWEDEPALTRRKGYALSR